MADFWTYDPKWDTWRFWHNDQNIVKVVRRKSDGELISYRSRESDITDEQTKQITIVSPQLFNLSDSGNSLHKRLFAAYRHLPTDFEPYGQRVREVAADCSCRCQHFLTLPEPLSFDWGVCLNPNSPRSGLLTFEHQGCEFFESE